MIDHEHPEEDGNAAPIRSVRGDGIPVAKRVVRGEGRSARGEGGGGAVGGELAEDSGQLIVKYNRNHDKLGRFTSGSSDSPTLVYAKSDGVAVGWNDMGPTWRLPTESLKAVIAEFDALPDDTMIYAYHATTSGYAAGLVSSPYIKPGMLNDSDSRDLRGKRTGKTDGLYVTPTVTNASDYGSHVVRVTVRKGDMVPSFEIGAYNHASLGRAFFNTSAGAVIPPGTPVKVAAVDTIIKYNPYHDSKGRFTTKGNGSGRSSSLSVQQARQAKLSAARSDKSMDVSRAMMERIVSDGGFTLDPLSSASARSGFSVGIAPDRSGHWGPGKVTPRAIDSWVRKNADKLSQPNTRVGGWLDTDTGDVWLDVVRVFPRGSEHSARLTAHNLNQIAMFSLHTGDTLNTMGTGSWPAPAGAIVWKSKRKSPMVLCIFDPSTPSIDIYKWAARKGVQQ